MFLDESATYVAAYIYCHNEEGHVPGNRSSVTIGLYSSSSLLVHVGSGSIKPIFFT
jgi:hypothetical protein